MPSYELRLLLFAQYILFGGQNWKVFNLKQKTEDKKPKSRNRCLLAMWQRVFVTNILFFHLKNNRLGWSCQSGPSSGGRGSNWSPIHFIYFPKTCSIHIHYLPMDFSMKRKGAMVRRTSCSKAITNYPIPPFLWLSWRPHIIAYKYIPTHIPKKITNMQSRSQNSCQESWIRTKVLNI